MNIFKKMRDHEIAEDILQQDRRLGALYEGRKKNKNLEALLYTMIFIAIIVVAMYLKII